MTSKTWRTARAEPLRTNTGVPPMHIAMDKPTSSTKGTLYFAFGSNLSTTQMLQRCPGSAQPLAVAKLNSYGWFICDRGYANVIAMPPAVSSAETEATTVWGLIYSLTAEDEASLDRYEGWNKARSGGPNPNVQERQRKPMLQGECSYNKLYLLAQVDKWLVDQHTRSSVWGIEQDPTRPALGDHVIRTLVYVDEVRTTPGRIKTEYIPRMSRAIKESVPLGIPESWANLTMRQHGIVWWLGDSAGKRARADTKWSNEIIPEEEWAAVREQVLLAQIESSRR